MVGCLHNLRNPFLLSSGLYTSQAALTADPVLVTDWLSSDGDSIP